MEKVKLPDDVLEFFRKAGAIGGKNRARRHSKAELSRWGRKGGRPKGSGRKKQATRKGGN
jgi:hypothetical protein